MKTLNRWRLFLPLLHFVIELPFVSIRTAIMHERMELQEREYVALDIRIWKWHFQLALYDTLRRMDMRGMVEVTCSESIYRYVLIQVVNNIPTGFAMGDSLMDVRDNCYDRDVIESMDSFVTSKIINDGVNDLGSGLFLLRSKKDS